ncbi:hypothetical protein E2C01_086870 [Portunus trituberculatus]|uniref:Uncharacterized protein n=1 Tax=Portunus trituberculatus TaxID=210409 RepID=A0A5B7J504_PORTR|nr:hypothetical protein [Portunus trituberculatus]
MFLERRDNAHNTYTAPQHPALPPTTHAQPTRRTRPSTAPKHPNTQTLTSTHTSSLCPSLPLVTSPALFSHLALKTTHPHPPSILGFRPHHTLYKTPQDHL